MEDNEQVVNQETTESTAPETQTTSEAPSGSERASQQQTESKYVPYERFQELVHARQESDARARSYEERMAQLQREFQSQIEALRAPQQKEVHPLVSKMREIDPQYGEYLEKLESRAGRFEAIEQELKQYKQEQLRNQYETAVSGLHEQNKVPSEVRSFIKAMLDSKAFSGELKNVGQVESEYKNVLAQYNKILEVNAREATKKYVQDKKRDSSTPGSQPKGVAASGKTGGKLEGSREDILAQIAKNAVARAKAEREL